MVLWSASCLVRAGLSAETCGAGGASANTACMDAGAADRDGGNYGLELAQLHRESFLALVRKDHHRIGSPAPDAAITAGVSPELDRAPTTRHFEALGDYHIAHVGNSSESKLLATRRAVRAWSMALHLQPLREDVRAKLRGVEGVKLCPWDGNVMIGAGGVGSFAQVVSLLSDRGHALEALLYLFAAAARTPGFDDIASTLPRRARGGQNRRREPQRVRRAPGFGRGGSDAPFLSAENAAAGFMNVAQDDANVSASWHVGLNLWARHLFDLARKGGGMGRLRAGGNERVLERLSEWRRAHAPEGSTVRESAPSPLTVPAVRLCRKSQHYFAADRYLIDGMLLSRLGEWRAASVLLRGAALHEEQRASPTTDVLLSTAAGVALFNFAPAGAELHEAVRHFSDAIRAARSGNAPGGASWVPRASGGGLDPARGSVAMRGARRTSRKLAERGLHRKTLRTAIAPLPFAVPSAEEALALSEGTGFANESAAWKALKAAYFARHSRFSRLIASGDGAWWREGAGGVSTKLVILRLPDVGIGNQVASVASALLLAMLSDRVLLLLPSVLAKHPFRNLESVWRLPGNDGEF